RRAMLEPPRNGGQPARPLTNRPPPRPAARNVEPPRPVYAVTERLGRMNIRADRTATGYDRPRPTIQCWECTGYGHVSRDCPHRAQARAAAASIRCNLYTGSSSGHDADEDEEQNQYEYAGTEDGEAWEERADDADDAADPPEARAATIGTRTVRLPNNARTVTLPCDARQARISTGRDLRLRALERAAAEDHNAEQNLAPRRPGVPRADSPTVEIRQPPPISGEEITTAPRTYSLAARLHAVNAGL